MSQTTVALPFEHRSKVIGRRCQGQCCVELHSLSSQKHYSNSTNVSIGWISLQYVLPIVPNFPDGTFTDFTLPPLCMLAQCIRLAQLYNDFTSLGFSQAGRLKFNPFPIAIYRIRGCRKRYE